MYLYALHPDIPAAKTMLFKSVLIPSLDINSSKYLALEAIIVIFKNRNVDKFHISDMKGKYLDQQPS